MERDVLLAERILLQTLSFDLNVVHPYQFFRQIIGKDLKGEVLIFLKILFVRFHDLAVMKESIAVNFCPIYSIELSIIGFNPLNYLFLRASQPGLLTPTTVSWCCAWRPHCSATASVPRCVCSTRSTSSVWRWCLCRCVFWTSSRLIITPWRVVTTVAMLIIMVLVIMIPPGWIWLRRTLMNKCCKVRHNWPIITAVRNPSSVLIFHSSSA